MQTLRTGNAKGFEYPFLKHIIHIDAFILCFCSSLSRRDFSTWPCTTCPRTLFFQCFSVLGSPASDSWPLSQSFRVCLHKGIQEIHFNCSFTILTEETSFCFLQSSPVKQVCTHIGTHTGQNISSKMRKELCLSILPKSIALTFLWFHLCYLKNKSKLTQNFIAIKTETNWSLDFLG